MHFSTLEGVTIFWIFQTGNILILKYHLKSSEVMVLIDMGHRPISGL